MCAKQDEIKIRKERILGIAIEEYIKTVSPVSSNHIVNEFPLDLSPATVRNVLAELEEDGFLTHPHTSAGRIPTQKGYRYYVDNLMNEIKMLEGEKVKIRAEYEKESKILENLLDKTSEILANVTHCTSIISVDGWDKKIFCRGTNFVVQYPDYNNLDEISRILVALDEKKRLLQIINRDLQKRINILIGHEMEALNIVSCSLVVSRYHTRKGDSGRIAVLGPTRMNYEKVVSTLEYLTDLMESI